MAKPAFCAFSVNYLGYTLTGEGNAPGKEKLLAVKEFPPPVSVKQIREFVGLCNYFGFLIPKLANCFHLHCQLSSFLGRNCVKAHE